MDGLVQDCSNSIANALHWSYNSRALSYRYHPPNLKETVF